MIYAMCISHTSKLLDSNSHENALDDVIEGVFACFDAAKLDDFQSTQPTFIGTNVGGRRGCDGLNQRSSVDCE